jgi:hypothetical protein
MKRSEIQKKLAQAARTLATKFQKGVGQAAPANTFTVAEQGVPFNGLGYVLAQAGLLKPRATLFTPVSALAEVLGTENGLIPLDVQKSAEALVGTKYSPNANRRAIIKPLQQFASTIAATKIRKPYTRTATTKMTSGFALGTNQLVYPGVTI